MKQPKLDVTIVCGSRPELLQETLVSLTKILLPGARFGRVLINIDKTHNQTDSHVSQSCDIAKQYFPQVEMNLTDSPSFGAAVKYLWSQIGGDGYFLHFEDDWRSLRKLSLGRIESSFQVDKRVKQVVLRREVISRKKEFSPYQTKGKDSSGRLGKFSAFSTSPSFIEKNWARTAADLMFPELHPEKQMHNGSNLALEDLCYKFRVVKYCWAFRRDVIKDLGAEWKRRNSIYGE